MTAEPAGQLAGALTLTGQLVTAARDGQWADPAPGPGWNVRDRASHITAGNRLSAAILPGQPGLPASGLGPAPRWRRRSSCLPRRCLAGSMPAVHIGVTPFV